MTMLVDGRRSPHSPPPRWEGLGVGGVVKGSLLPNTVLPPAQRLIRTPLTRSFAPHPYPLPTRGRGRALSIRRQGRD